MKHFYRKIQGWSSFVPWYTEMVDAAPRDRASIFVEIGCWKGKSAAYMGVEIANSRKPIEFFTVDTFEGSEEHAADPALPRLEQIAIRNLRPVRNWVTIVKRDSADFANAFVDESVDFVFIDGDHSYEGVTRDIDAWWPKLKRGGVMAGDDYVWSSVFRAVNDSMATRILENGTIETAFGINGAKCWRVRKAV